jgi:L-amino acid N-acyltransferase
MRIRDAMEGDIDRVAAIYNEVLRTSTAIFNDRPVSVEDRVKWWRGRVEQGYPVLVALEGEAVVGFASFGEFRSWPGYRFTVEHTVHVHSEFRGKDVGSALMRELIERARVAGKHVMVGGVDAENVASLRFHERMGFERVAHLREVGFKADRYLDLVLLQRWITPPAHAKEVAGSPR